MDSGFRRNDEQNRKNCRDRPPCLSDALFYKGQPQGQGGHTGPPLP